MTGKPEHYVYVFSRLLHGVAKFQRIPIIGYKKESLQAYHVTNSMVNRKHLTNYYLFMKAVFLS